ncbi:MAG: tRNA 2-thiouridine(34) synthase MnmA [Alphaproteobacteria bacterium]
MTVPFDVDLGTPKPRRAIRVVVAMSGGVDSSTVAALYARSGYDVVGVTLQLYDHGKAMERPGACCAGADIHDARRVADVLNIPHYVLDFEARFRAAVIDDFVATYLKGETPVPCVRCNQRVKFADLMDVARDLGADALATGHYVRRVVRDDGGVELHRGAEVARDQSYFLFATTRVQLGFLRFPLGGATKDETRALAAAAGLPVAAKRDSQDICFVPEGGYARLVERLRPEAAEAGDIVDGTGRLLGRHGGIARFTVGQRHGLGLAGPDPLYVSAIDAATRRIVVGPRSTLGSTRVVARAVNWLGEGEAPMPGQAVSVKLRSSQAPAPARVGAFDDGRIELALDRAVGAIAPGQACVIYDGERVLGGGWIARPESHAAALMS